MRKFFILNLLLSLLFITISCKKNNYVLIEHENYYEYQDISYGKHKRQVLNLCLPKDTNTNGLILFIHGGYWISGDKNSNNGSLKAWCQEGYATCAINYHYISNRFNYQDIINDITLSLSKVKEVASNHNINLTKLMLTGHSAGGHLSLLYAYQELDTAPIKPTCVASLSGPTDLTDENYFNDSSFNIKLIYIFSNLTGKYISNRNYLNKLDYLLNASPTNYITKETVPTIIAHGELDDVVPFSNAERLKNKLDESGVYNIFISFPNSGHNLENDPDSSAYLNTMMYEFTNKFLK